MGTGCTIEWAYASGQDLQVSGSVDGDRLYKWVGLWMGTSCTSEWVCGWGQAVQVSGSGDEESENRLYK